jgi:starch synthase
MTSGGADVDTNPYSIRPLGGRRVVHLTAEYWPFARTGGLAEAVRGLAQHHASAGQLTTVVMPFYSSMRRAAGTTETVVDAFSIDVGGRQETGSIRRFVGDGSGPAVFFIDHPDYFDRAGIYGEDGADYPDNMRRFAFFCRAATTLLPRICPDAGVVHAHDWHTALSIPYIRYQHAGDPFYDGLGTVLSIHNAAYQGHFPPEAIKDIGLPWSMYDWRYFEWYDRVNILKGGLAFTDFATTVSPTHAAELRTPDGGFGLHDHFTSMGDRFVGILNGIDYSLWDPAADPFLTASFSREDLSARRRNKASLQRSYSLPRRQRVPVFAMSARLVEQKGLDLILADGLLTRYDAQFIFLGRGDPAYERALVEAARLAPDRVAVPLAFDERLEHRLLAGADLLLMPSQFEPCGLTQMRAQRYGAIPVARRVGGLTDTIVDGITGFLFDAYQPKSLERAVRRSIAAYHDTAQWNAVVQEGMDRDFSWSPSAARYQQIYHRAVASRGANP